MLPIRAMRPIVLTSVLLLLACAAPQPPERELAAASRDFAQRLRWLDLQAAAGYLAEEHREGFLERFRRLEDLRITDARVESVELQGEGGRSWTVLEYYLLPSLTVKKLRFPQDWAYQRADRYRPGEWRVVSPFPSFP